MSKNPRSRATAEGPSPGSGSSRASTPRRGETPATALNAVDPTLMAAASGKPQGPKPVSIASS